MIHLTDDVRLFTRAAIDNPRYPMGPAVVIRGMVLEDCCSWREVEVRRIDSTPPRSRIDTSVVHRGVRREFIGFNARGMPHSAGRRLCQAPAPVLLRAFIDSEMARLQVIVDKTGGTAELESMALLTIYIRDSQVSADR